MSYRVLYIGGFELPDKNAAAFRVNANAGLLIEMGCTVYFRGVSKCNNIQDNFVKKGEFYCSEIKYPSSTKEWIKYSFTSENVIKQIEKLHIDVVICYNYPSFALKKIIRYCHKNRVKVVNECTEWYSSKGMGVLRGFIKKIDTLMRILLIPQIVDYNIVTTEYLAEKMKGRSCIIPEVYTIQTPYKEKPCADITVNLIYMGTPGLKFNKDNIGKMVDILSNVNANYHFDIVGINEDEFFKHLCLNEGNYVKIKNRITFWGRVDHNRCIEMLSAADYTFLYRDVSKISLAGFPRKVSESLQFNVPVITTKTSDLSKYIINGKTGYVISFDKDKAAKEIEKILRLGKKHSTSLKETISSSSPLLASRFRSQINDMICALEEKR